MHQNCWIDKVIAQCPIGKQNGENFEIYGAFKWMSLYEEEDWNKEILIEERKAVENWQKVNKHQFKYGIMLKNA